MSVFWLTILSPSCNLCLSFVWFACLGFAFLYFITLMLKANRHTDFLMGGSNNPLVRTAMQPPPWRSGLRSGVQTFKLESHVITREM